MNKALEVCDLLFYSTWSDMLSEFMSVCRNLKNELLLKRIFEKKYVQIYLFSYLLPEFLQLCPYRSLLILGELSSLPYSTSLGMVMILQRRQQL